MDNKVKVILVDDDDDFATLFKKMITSDSRIDYLGRASNKASGVALSFETSPDIVVMDLNLSGIALDGIEAAKEIRIKTGIKVLLLTAYEQTEIILDASSRSFASGYIFKSQFQMMTHIIHRTVTSNTPEKEYIKELVLGKLSPAERRVLEDLINQNDNMISSPSTINNQKTSIFKKLGIKNTKELLKVFSNW